MLAIAHRTPDDAPGVAALADAGVNVFEVDLRLIGDDLVSTHFRPLIRAFPKLQQDNGRLRWGLRDPREPTLAAIQALLPPGAEVLLDLKDDVGPAARVLTEHLVDALPDPSRFYVCSKHWQTLGRLQAAGFRTWLTVHDRATLEALTRDGLSGAWAATARHTLLRDELVFDRVLAAADGQLIAWTVNDRGRAEHLLRRGVLGLTSDELEVHRLVASWGTSPIS